MIHRVTRSGVRWKWGVCSSTKAGAEDTGSYKRPEPPSLMGVTVMSLFLLTAMAPWEVLATDDKTENPGPG